MRFGVVRFPGSNCDQDAYYVLRDVIKKPVEYIWHEERSLSGFDCVVLPGGFSYGDYLRTGAIARFSPVMDAVISHAERGGLVLGICNGFQVLCEARLLPGALIRNNTTRFRCRQVHLRVETSRSAFTCEAKVGQVLQIPIAHGEGCYVADEETLRELNDRDQVVFRYCDPSGGVTEQANPNGSLENIAGIANAEGNVVGMMPHPERASERLLGSDDGRVIFTSAVRSLLIAHR
jgi:phosphoribosylformylglycinamidine synthase